MRKAYAAAPENMGPIAEHVVLFLLQWSS